MGTPLTERGQQAAIKRMTDRNGFIRVWKVVRDSSGAFRSVFWSSLNRTPGSGIRQARNVDLRMGGWHVFRQKPHPQVDNQKVIECLALPEWLKLCGYDSCCWWTRPKHIRTATFTHLCFPEYPKTKVTVREFRAELKKWRAMQK